MAENKIKEGSKVKFHYTGKLTTGEVFDTSENRDALEFIAGKGMIIPGLEKEMMGLKKGDKKTITVKAEDAYGQYNKELEKEVPKGPLPPEMKLEKGAVLYLKSPEGHPIPVRVVDVKEKTIVLDLNHPLAGKDLVFEFEIVEVN
ncbi:peptidylprolyl isomerase [Candidatus Woesearchaeota archaeon]|nr:peptidylprolyl isomerase [Candidatus Woesearchaeota archaeon]